MKKYIFIALAAIAALSSCAKESLVSNDENGKEAQVFTATMEDCVTTKATFDGTNKCAFWEINDEVSINGKKYKAQSAGTTTTFAAIDGGAEGPTYNAYFPAGLYDGTNATLPANVSETWAADKFNMPMYAESSTFDLSFKNLCGVLKITVTNTQLASVKCITVSSTNKAVSGAFTVDANNAAVLTDASKTANTVTVTYTDAVNTDATGKVFYVAIPAQTYKNLSIAVSDGTTTKVMTTKADQDITVARKTVYPIAFDGSLTTTGTAKRTGDIDEKWIRLWEDGPMFAEYNVGVTDGKAESYGGYYTWGGTYENGQGITWDDDHNSLHTTGNDNLTSTEDTATKLWGSNWRMPTQTELKGLIDNCNVAWTNVNGKDGRKFTGKGAYASNSVFLPAAGYCNIGSISNPDYGFYWSSTPVPKATPPSTTAYRLNFNSGVQGVVGYSRSNGCSVRAVLAE